jgi:hypothetical protein
MLIGFVLQIVAVAPQAAASEQEISRHKETVVHGRLSISNGTPSCRIWVVGTKRVLGIQEADTECPIPTQLIDALREDIDDRAIYADFTVIELTSPRKGTMQIVTLTSAQRVVVTTRNGRFLRRIQDTAK